MTRFYVGTAGWSYLGWDKEFYPKAIKAREKLAFYATQFNAVELNNSFYQKPKPQQLERWEAEVPGLFRFALKAPRFITHVKKLRDPDKILPQLFEAIEDRRKPGPVLFQIPPDLPLDIERLQNFLKRLSNGSRYAIQLRDPSWHTDKVYALLKTHKVAFCLFDTEEGKSPRVLTTDFAYLRLRGRSSSKLKPFLEEWASFLEKNTKLAHVFFDNRQNKSLAFRNALLFRDLLTDKKKKRPKPLR